MKCGPSKIDGFRLGNVCFQPHHAPGSDRISFDIFFSIKGTVVAEHVGVHLTIAADTASMTEEEKTFRNAYDTIVRCIEDRVANLYFNRVEKTRDAAEKAVPLGMDNPFDYRGSTKG
jgi:hypothetical protein